MTDILSRDTFKAGLVAEGTVTVPAPSADTDASTKKYVDDKVAAGGGTAEVYAQTTAPGASAADIIWLDIDDTTTEVATAGVKITVSSTAPVGAVDGDLWVDTS